LTLDILPGWFAICRLDSEAAVPTWAAGALTSVTRTANELSILCDATGVPPTVTGQRDYRGLAVRGPLDFSLVGVVADLSRALAAASVSILVVSTYDTDYLFVRDAHLTRAVAALRDQGHTIVSGV
jgi:hypothetical protein